ncbi:MAG: hypothetical protein LBD11_05200 [Candidatus Peribacteria bacterium]|jgi:hypothetical protein|nr:hypothetical protein [Candidatus Peribacteria bacterium]
MNVLVINPPNIPFTNPGILIEPIDVLTIATSIQSQDFSVSILDMDVRKMLTNDLKSYLENKNFSHVIIVYDYHIPLHTNEAFNEILHIAQTLKNA